MSKRERERKEKKKSEKRAEAGHLVRDRRAHQGDAIGHTTVFFFFLNGASLCIEAATGVITRGSEYRYPFVIAASQSPRVHDSVSVRIDGIIGPRQSESCISLVPLD